jgi:putative oxidoreductase
MSGLRDLARPMLASIFVTQGLEVFQHPERVSALAEPVVKPLAERVPAVPAETEHAVRINAAVQVGAGTLLGLGLAPRLSALAIAGTMVPTTLAGHRFWEAEDDQDRKRQRIEFLKNVTMVGGLLLAAGDTEGNPSLAWRRRQAAKRANRQLAGLRLATRSAADSASAVGDQAALAYAAMTDAAKAAVGYLTEAAETIADAARKNGRHQPPPGRARAAAASVQAAARHVAHAAQGAVSTAPRGRGR